MVYRLKTCCGCGDLRTGTIIIAALCIAGGLLGSLFSIMPEDDNEFYDYGEFYVLDKNSSKLSDIVEASTYTGLTTVSIIMIIGGVKKNWKMIVPWLVLDGLIIGLQLIGLIILGSTLNMLCIFLGVILIVLSGYLWYIPFSYHLILKEEYEEPVENKSENC